MKIPYRLANSKRICDVAVDGPTLIGGQQDHQEEGPCSSPLSAIPGITQCRCPAFKQSIWLKSKQ
jgi:hypothetical protein